MQFLVILPYLAIIFWSLPGTIKAGVITDLISGVGDRINSAGQRLTQGINTGFHLISPPAHSKNKPEQAPQSGGYQHNNPRPPPLGHHHHHHHHNNEHWQHPPNNQNYGHYQNEYQQNGYGSINRPTKPNSYPPNSQGHYGSGYYNPHEDQSQYPKPGNSDNHNNENFHPNDQQNGQGNYQPSATPPNMNKRPDYNSNNPTDESIDSQDPSNNNKYPGNKQPTTVINTTKKSVHPGTIDEDSNSNQNIVDDNIHDIFGTTGPSSQNKNEDEEPEFSLDIRISNATRT